VDLLLELNATSLPVISLLIDHHLIRLFGLAAAQILLLLLQS
jgi:hypothetical protein